MNIKVKKGMTILEMTITLALFSVLSLIVSQMVARSFKTYRAAHQTIDMQERTALVLREFEFSTRAASDILTAENNQLVYYRYYDLETSSSPTKVRYFVDGNVFKVSKSLPVGTIPNVTYPDVKPKLLIENLINPEIIFHYYDSQGVELSQPINLSAVKMIGLEFSIDVNPGSSPTQITEITKVNLRNMKINL